MSAHLKKITWQKLIVEGLFAMAFAVFGAAPAVSGMTVVPAPVYGAYLGAWVPGSELLSVEEATEIFETQISELQVPPATFRRLDLHLHYYPFARLVNGSYVPSFPDEAMKQDALHRRIPVVTWHCGSGLGATDAAIAAGKWDDIIDATAAAVKSYAKPIMLRWYWEMNLNPQANEGQNCMGTTRYPYPASAAKNFIAAWRHIHDRFKKLGVTNVAWLWNPAGIRRLHPDPGPFYPGSAYVDWIGFDGYDKLDDHDFGKLFIEFYDEFATNFRTNFPGQARRPLLVGETGECAGTLADGDDIQSVYLQSAQLEIKGQPNPNNYSFPWVKGIDYFDARGIYQCPTGETAWRLTPAALEQFGKMAYDPFFNVRHQTVRRQWW